MNHKIAGIFVGILLIVTVVPTVVSLDDGAVTATPSGPSELRQALIFGRYTNLTGADGIITLEAVNLWALFKQPTSLSHFPRGTSLTFDMYTAYGHIYRKVNLIFLHVQLDV
ncbi:MAG TPA: hypothetical protein HA258_00065 [Thermoplasmata archaeon]|jgi:hypothetical protein|nr:hypothetical protein [Thermoplasmata archaeon]HIH29277.1 hypothetical protein [Thermoplasmata archaeon]